MPIDPKKWTREELERHSVDMRQFIDFRQSTLTNGMRIIEAYNSSGLTFTILPDRGMDIWTAHYKGIPLTWISQGSPYPPDFGQTWLQQFNGGLLTTCGLTHVGPPETDDVTGEVRGIHGDYTRLRAQDIWVDRDQSGGWHKTFDVLPTFFDGLDGFVENYTQEHGGEEKTVATTIDHLKKLGEQEFYELILHGTIYQTSLFGVQLRLDRTIHLTLGDPSFSIFDSITNMGDMPSPLMLLYHINPGYPIIQAGTQFYAQHENVYPRDAAAKAGYSTWAQYDEATSGYPEQVFYHHMIGHPNYGDGARTQVMLVNKAQDFGIQLDWDADNLPYFSQWKNTRQGLYVCGIEPANCVPEGQNAARKNKRLMVLEPGQKMETGWSIRAIDDAKTISIYKDIIERFQRDGTPLPNCSLEDYAKFAQES